MCEMLVLFIVCYMFYAAICFIGCLYAQVKNTFWQLLVMIIHLSYVSEFKFAISSVQLRWEFSYLRLAYN